MTGPVTTPPNSTPTKGPTNGPTSEPTLGPEEFRPIAGLLALVLPGAGHFILGERKRAALIAVGILGMFFGGLLIGGVDCIDRKEDRIWFLGQALVGPLTFAVDYVHQNHLKGYDMSGRHRTQGPNERGTFENSNGRLVRRIYPLDEGQVLDPGNPLALPPPYSKSLGRMNEIGTLFVALAGMINLIVFLDALLHRSRRGSHG